MSMYQNFLDRWNKLKQDYYHFNIFESTPPSNDPYVLQNQRISSRLFTIALILSLGVLIFYNSLVSTNQTIVVYRPKFEQYVHLYSKHSDALRCTCNRISVKYDKFIEIDYTLHYLCTSFFVSEEWLQYLIHMIHEGVLNNDDFRITGYMGFRTLRGFCQLMDRMIQSSLTNFYFNNYINLYLPSSDLFRKENDVQVHNFITTTTERILSSLQIISETTQANSLLSALQTNFYLYQDVSSRYVYSFVKSYNECSCFVSASCFKSSVLYDDTYRSALFFVPGFYSGCYIVESLLHSTLECFHEASCFNLLKQHIRSNVQINGTILNASLSTKFTASTTIKELVDHLLVEKWNWNVMFENYYKECEPIQCTYTGTGKQDLVYIFVVMTGIVGGLITGLMVIIPWLVSFSRYIVRSTKIEASLSFKQRVILLWQQTGKYIHDFNVYPSLPASRSLSIIQDKTTLTRLCVLSLILSITIILIYNSISLVDKTVTIKRPNYQQYSHLYSSHVNHLQCTCNQISISYNKFVDIDYAQHHICRSFFVSEEWIQYLVHTNSQGVLHADDFRSVSRVAFQALRTLCQLTDRMIRNSLDNFRTSQYFNAFLTLENLFRNENELRFQQLIASTTEKFLSSLEIIRDTSQVNALSSALQTNYYYYSYNVPGYVVSYPAVYYNCSCVEKSSCLTPVVFYSSFVGSVLFRVPGLYSGCFVIESLLHSNLECIHDEFCLEQIRYHVQSSISMNFSSLSASLSNKYKMNTTIKEIVNNLMIEYWKFNVSYEKYYSECDPAQCTYIIQDRRESLYIITIMVGLFGGLVTILKFIITWLLNAIKIIFRTRSGNRLNLTHNAHFISASYKRFLRNINVFSSFSPTNESQMIYDQRISTRLFTFLLIMSIIILITQNSLSTIGTTIIVNQPTYHEYSELLVKYSDDLQCPCNEISIAYSEFLQIDYIPHYICTSFLVSEEWIQYLIYTTVRGILYADDFRSVGRFAFQALRAFCQLTERMIRTSLTGFYSTHYLSRFLTTSQLFQNETQVYITQFILETTEKFLSTLEMIHETSQDNALLSALYTNFYAIQYTSPGNIYFSSNSNGETTCMETSLCLIPARIYDTNVEQILFRVPGFYSGCFITQSLLHSTLECFHDQDCFEQVKQHVGSVNTINAMILNASLSNHFTANTTIGEIANRLMIEEWHKTIDYEKYYNACKPIRCSYNIDSRKSVMYALPTIISLIGGLATILKLTLHRIVKVVMQCIRGRRTEIHPEIAVIASAPLPNIDITH